MKSNSTNKKIEKITTMENQLQAVVTEIAEIKTKRAEITILNGRRYHMTPRFKAHRLSHLIGLRSSLQANLARA